MRKALSFTDRKLGSPACRSFQARKTDIRWHQSGDRKSSLLVFLLSGSMREAPRPHPVQDQTLLADTESISCSCVSNIEILSLDENPLDGALKETVCPGASFCRRFQK